MVTLFALVVNSVVNGYGWALIKGIAQAPFHQRFFNLKFNFKKYNLILHVKLHFIWAKILHMPQQLSCHVMCKNLARLDIFFPF